MKKEDGNDQVELVRIQHDQPKGQQNVKKKVKQVAAVVRRIMLI
jgi:hypothetical protein